MAVAAAGGGLLIAAAGTVPASASARPAPHRGHTITITAQPRAHAARGIGPHDILPCATKPGAAIKPASCGQQTIICFITANSPMLMPDHTILASASVDCDNDVDEIDFEEAMLRNGSSFLRKGMTAAGTDTAGAFIQFSCLAGTYTNTAEATITLPSGYILTAGSNPIHITSPGVTISASDCNPPGGGGGGGGGGGCAMPAPSLAGHLAGRHPDLISCV